MQPWKDSPILWLLVSAVMETPLAPNIPHDLKSILTYDLFIFWDLITEFITAIILFGEGCVTN